jgi:RNA polymerase sigma-70 factor (ECF subfamily)
MVEHCEPSFQQAPHSDTFRSTHWSVVLAARDKDSPTAVEALEALCRAYWVPLCAFVRRLGYQPHDAQDLTQAFFTRLLEKDTLAQVAREKGRFRAFLIASMKHFLANEWDRANSLKRGGAVTFIPWEDDHAARHFRLEPAPDLSADVIYDRQWALTVLERVFVRLRAESATAGKAQLFDALRSYLSGESSGTPYAEAGAALGMTAGAVQVAVHRLRRRYGELLRDEIANTVSQPKDIEDELRYLLAALR